MWQHHAVDPLVRTVDRALDRLAVERTGPILVACSGGPDSAALAHAAMDLAARGRLGPITLAYVDHQLRPDSAADGQKVAALAARGGAGAVTVAVSVDRDRRSLEEAAREARYRALTELADRRGVVAILVAHTADDQAETVLMRIVRGTGVAGLAGIPARRGRIARPLLEVRRARIEAYCRRHQLDTVADPMNDDARHLRNRVRATWLPALRRENPALDRALVGLARQAAEASAALDRAAGELAVRARAPDGNGWDVEVLRAAPAGALHRVLGEAARTAGATRLSARHHRALVGLIRRTTGGTASIDLPGLVAIREYDRLRFEPPEADAAGADAGAGAGALPGAAAVAGSTLEGIVVQGPDAPYQVRLWRPGDRMRPRRLGGRSRKLSDLFTDARVPRRRRAGARVVVRPQDGRIEWAEHLGQAFGSEVEVSLTPRESVATNKVR